jgi:hypothetical protein
MPEVARLKFADGLRACERDAELGDKLRSCPSRFVLVAAQKLSDVLHQQRSCDTGIGS